VSERVVGLTNDGRATVFSPPIALRCVSRGNAGVLAPFPGNRGYGFTRLPAVRYARWSSRFRPLPSRSATFYSPAAAAAPP
jgi:hypothetical protein